MLATRAGQVAQTVPQERNRTPESTPTTQLPANTVVATDDAGCMSQQHDDDRGYGGKLASRDLSMDPHETSPQKTGWAYESDTASTMSKMTWQPGIVEYVEAYAWWGRMCGVVYRTGRWRVYEGKRVYARGDGGRAGCESALRKIVKARYDKGRVVKVSAEKMAERVELLRRLVDE